MRTKQTQRSKKSKKKCLENRINPASHETLLKSNCALAKCLQQEYLLHKTNLTNPTQDEAPTIYENVL